MTVSTRKLSGLTDQPQKTPATIMHDIVKERDISKQKRAHNVLPAYPLFDSDLHAHAIEPKLLQIVLQSLYLDVWDVVL